MVYQAGHRMLTMGKSAAMIFHHHIMATGSNGSRGETTTSFKMATSMSYRAPFDSLLAKLRGEFSA